MRCRLVAVVALTAAMAAACALLWPPRTANDTALPPPPIPSSPTTSLAETPALERTAITEDRADAVATASVEFDAAIAKLVDLLLQGQEHLERGDAPRVEAIDEEAWRLIKRVLAHCTDFDVRALFALTGLGALTDPRAQATRGVLANFLRFGLQKHAAAAIAAEGTTSAQGKGLATYVASLLEIVVPHEANALTVATLLHDQPYLDETHEPALQRLLELVATYPWLARPTRQMLLTLWRNVAARDAGARERIETLALTLKDDANPVRRAAALEHLMQHGDRGLVDFVVADIEEQRDVERARDLALVAASKLPPDHALEVFTRLRRTAARTLMAGAIELGRRAPERVRARYEELRSADTDADLRADLVTGMGCNPDAENCGAVWAALQTDPSMDVRERALFALTANAASSYGERAVEAALANATFCGKHGERLCAVVACIGNLARSGESEAVARLVQACRARRDLSPRTRADLEAIARGDSLRGPPVTR